MKLKLAVIIETSVGQDDEEMVFHLYDITNALFVLHEKMDDLEQEWSIHGSDDPGLPRKFEFQTDEGLATVKAKLRRVDK